MAENRKWTMGEYNLAKKLRKQGLTHAEIGAQINRSEFAVRQQLSLKKDKINFNVEDDFGKQIINRTRITFTEGAVYEINHIARSGGIEYLPAQFKFIEEVKGKNCNMYIFESVKGQYKVTFSNRQIPDSYIFHKIDE